jgi:hypothetical protein
LKSNGEPWLNLIGRLRPGINPNALESQLQTELRQWLASHAADMTAGERKLWIHETLHLTPGGAGVSLIGKTKKDAFWMLLLAAACVLLVACANTANLLLVRSLKDRSQTALRAALGASRRRLVSKAFIESFVLAILGAAAGIAVAFAAAGMIFRLTFTGWVPFNATPSIPVLLFALGVSVVTALIFGTVPAWTSVKTDPIEALRCPVAARQSARLESCRSAKDAGHRTGGDIACFVERGSDAGPEPPQPGASESRIRLRRPLSRRDRSKDFELHRRTTCAIVSRNRGAIRSDSGRTQGRRCARRSEERLGHGP